LSGNIYFVRMPPLRHLLLLLPLVVSTGCAGLLNKGNDTVTVTSIPEDAIVLVNGAEVGRTPYEVGYVKEMGPVVTVELRKEGYELASVTLPVARNNGVLLADAMLLGIPYIFDARSDAMRGFRTRTVQVPLFRTVREDMQRLELPVATLQSTVNGVPLGRLGSHRLHSDSKEMSDLKYPEMITSSVVQGFTGSWADARVVRLGTERGDEAIQRAKFYLVPKLKRLWIEAKEKDHLVNGTVETEMDWCFMSAVKKDSVLFTIPSRNVHPLSGCSKREVLSGALQAASRRLLEDTTLHERLLAAYGAGLIMAKGSELVLSKQRPITFAGRREMLGALVKGVVTVETSDGHGSGFLITNDGHLLTNAHVVGNDATVKVRFEQGFALDGQVVKVNKDFDVALIKVPRTDLPALAIGDDKALLLGEELFAIGTPLNEQLGQSVTRGIMSGRREVEGRSYLQTDVSINPGNSGGPLIDESGKVVGVATLKISAKGVEGIGFGVPISKALEMLNIRFAE
jgi:S1-C subfamily serine protease